MREAVGHHILGTLTISGTPSRHFLPARLFRFAPRRHTGLELLASLLNFGTRPPNGDRLSREANEEALSKLLDSRKPVRLLSDRGAPYREPDILQFVCSQRSRLETREAIKAGHFPK